MAQLLCISEAGEELWRQKYATQEREEKEAKN